MIDLYTILEVDPRAGQDTIQAAYRTLSKRYHPDTGHGDTAAMARVNDAYGILSNPDSRERYDALYWTEWTTPTTFAQATTILGRHRLSFGKHRGAFLQDIPLEYLRWALNAKAGSYSDQRAIGAFLQAIR